MTDRSLAGRQPYLKSITCYQEDICRTMTGGVTICTPADVWNAGRSFINRNASAVWKGTLHGGEGKLTTESGVLSETQYSYRKSFAEGIGSNGSRRNHHAPARTTSRRAHGGRLR